MLIQDTTTAYKPTRLFDDFAADASYRNGFLLSFGFVSVAAINVMWWEC